MAEVTPVEIARLAGVGRAAVSNWRRRYEDFPQPVGGTATSPRFALAEVEAWLRGQGKLAELPAEELAWQQIRGSWSDHELPEAVRHAGELLLSGEPRRPGERRSGELAAVPPDRQGRTLPAALAELASGHGTAAAFELLLQRTQEAARLPRVPDRVAELMAALLDPAGSDIYDPACGTGTLLLAALARFPRAQLHGDETDPVLRDLARLRITAHHGRGSFGEGGLRQAADPPLTADGVLCSPPHAERAWAGGDLAYDPRWRYGVPPRAEPELAWAQHALANLRPGGRAVLLLQPAVAARASGRRIRAELLRRGALRAVIGLPPGGAGSHPGPQLWVLRRPADDDHPDRVLVAELPAATGPGAGAWPGYAPGLVLALDAMDRGEELPDLAPVTARAFRVMDLLDDAVDLSTARRLRIHTEPVDGIEVIRLRDQVAGLLDRLTSLLPTFTAGPAADPGPAPDGLPMITMLDLSRTGAVAITLHNPLRQEPDAGAPAPEDPVPVWRARDVIAGHPPAASLPAGQVPEDAIRLAPGDVVAPVIGPRLLARVVTGAEAGAVLGPNLYLLRPEPATLDPWFLAGFLRRDSNTHRAGSLGSIHRYDIRRAQVPRVPFDEQRRYGELFQRLAEFDRLLRQATGTADTLMRLAVDGLAAGTLHPPG